MRAALGAALVLIGGVIAWRLVAVSGGEPFAPAGALAYAGTINRLLGSVREPVAPRPVHLRVPRDDRLLVPATPRTPAAVPPGELRAHAFQWVSRVWSRAGKRNHARGYVRRGVVLRAYERVSSAGCSGGWYSLEGGRVVCNGDGFAISREPRAEVDQRKPDVTRALPFRYAKVVAEDALRFHRIPSAAEELEIGRAIAEDLRLPDVVEQQLRGIYLLALDREVQVDDRSFERTVRGRFVRAEALEPKPEPAMRGMLLGDGTTLPVAFVYGHELDPAPVYALEEANGEPVLVGSADNHARIRVLDVVEQGARRFVVGRDGFVLERAHVRVARRIVRPSAIPAGRKWIHVDLSEQTLVAYEGDQPVFATLVSSGKGAEHATPEGLYRISEKHISTTMRGEDPEEGRYEVEEVPWTQYYHDSYALHGAYWHDSFGQVRSHGCTNIAPIDARWLFYWTDGTVPAGWNALRNIEGTQVYLTDGSA